MLKNSTGGVYQYTWDFRRQDYKKLEFCENCHLEKNLATVKVGHFFKTKKHLLKIGQML